MRHLKLRNVVQLPDPHRAPGISSRSQPGLKVSPAGNPSPALVAFPRWQKARDRATAAVLAGERRLLVTGPAGVGKTLLLEHVARTLRAAGWEASVRLAGADPQPPAAPLPAVLLVDEADRLPREALQRLLLGTSGPLVLAGLETLAGRVPGATRISLTTLGFEDARDYIAQWLALSGRTPAHLASAAMRRIVELSSGVPRLLSTLLGASAWLAESEGAPVISVQHVNDAGALRSCFGALDDEPGWEAETGAEAAAAAPPVRARRLPGYAAALTAMLVLGAGGFLAARTWPSETQQAAQFAQATITQLASQSRARLADLFAEVLASSVAPTPTAEIAAQNPALPPTPAETQASVSAAITAEPAAPDLVAADPAAGPVAPAPEPPQAGSLDTAPWTGPAEIAAAPEPEPAPAPAPAAAAPSGPPVIPSAAPPAPRAELPRSMMEVLGRRGQQMLALGDISAARLLFGRAAEAGDIEAMLAMGQTYDPIALPAASSLLTPDAARAASWYRLAAAAGSIRAAALLQRAMALTTR